MHRNPDIDSQSAPAASQRFGRYRLEGVWIAQNFAASFGATIPFLVGVYAAAAAAP